jgi:cation diffusion facilitator family transporter
MVNYFIKKFVGDKYDPNDSAVRRRLGMLSGIVGIICNLTLSAGKFFVGLITSSIAVSADAFNNLSDAASSIVTLICFKTSDSPANKDHPFGYGRIEYISGLIVSMAIIFTGIEFIKTSVEKIFDPEPVSSGIVPIVILFGSLIVKLWLGALNKKIGNIIHSTAMKATAFDSLLDAIITVTILIGLGITYFTGVSIDAYLGIVVALFIIFTGISMIKETVDPLIGQPPSPEFVKEINDVVFSFPDVVGIHELMVHNYGYGKSVISLHAEMPANKDIMDLHETVDAIEKKLKNKFKCQAIIHIDPIETDDAVVNDMRDKLSKLVKLIHKDAKVYDLRIVPRGTPTLIFHVSVPYDIKQTDKEIIDAVTISVKAIYPLYECIIDVDRNYFDPQPPDDNSKNS